VVATDCPSGPGEVLESGRFGRLTPVADEAGLAEAIVQTLENPLPSNALMSAAMPFSVGQATSRYVEILGIETGAKGRAPDGTDD
jgi:glycosyltransferase involved in cell wall biosynthesis